jgi:hypothetical protein
MKKISVCISILSLIAVLNSSLSAQPQYYNFNNGSGANSFPFNVTTGKDVQLLYLAGSFNQPTPAPAGNIVSISLRLSSAMSSVTYTTLTIQMGQSVITNLTSGSFYTGPMTTVYSRASVVWNYPVGWATITLDTPFAYDPTQSLIVDIGQCGASAGGGILYYTTQTNNLRVWSVGGCPFVCYASVSTYNYDMGINLAAASGPTVVTTAATAITTTTATLNGTVNANGSSTAVSFDYGLTTAYGTTVPGVPSPVNGSGITAVAAAITGLTPGTLYHFRVNGTNSNGSANGSDLTFTTSTPPPPPTVVTTAANAITGTTATLNGTVNANNASTAVTFDYGLTAAYGTTVSGVPSPVTGNVVTPVSAAIAGLTPNTLYHFRVNGVNVSGTSNGGDLTFTTASIPPTVVTGATTGVSSTTATMNGTVNANNTSTNVFFDYGLTIAYGSTVGGIPSPVSGSVVTPVSASLSSLTPSTTYHYRVRGVNAGGTSNGNDQTFFTACNVAGSAGAITGPAQVCNGGMGYIYSVAPITNASGYSWTVPFGAFIIAGSNTNSITVNFPNPSFSGNISVYGLGCAGNGSSSNLSVSVNPAATPTLTGLATVCSGYTGNVYTTQSGMTNYVWSIVGGTITGGGTAGSNTATVTWNTAGTQSISVNYTNAGGCAGLVPATFNVTVNASPAPTFTGNANPCTALNNVYSTQAGMTNYVWTVSAGGTITAGAGTNSVTVVWNTVGAQTVNVTYANSLGCSNTVPASYAVTVKQGPTPTITGTSSLCVNSGNYTYSTEAGMTGYTWTLSPGGVIISGSNTNVVSISWTVPGAQWVKVNYTNVNGCQALNPAQFNVTVYSLPAATGPITGSANVCAGVTGVVYSVAAVPGAISYVWTLPAGAVNSTGSLTNSITVDFAANASSGNIMVYANNLCGNGSASPPFAVTVTPLAGAAGTITGPASVCQGATGAVYTVPIIAGATGYIWTVPAGATIMSGGNTNSIVVDFSASAVSGNITVLGTNTCGNGVVSPNFPVTVNPKPPTPVVTSLGWIASSSEPLGNQWYYSPTWSGTGALIPGATASTYDASLIGIGYYWSIVTLNGCSSDSSNHQFVYWEGVSSHSSSAINIYPVPNDGQFKVSMTSSSHETFTIKVFNVLGTMISELKGIEVNGTVEKIIDLRPVPNGVYSVIFENSVGQTVKKIVVNK